MSSVSKMRNSGAEPCVRPIDLVHLSRYTLGDRALEAELLGLFRSQTRIYLERMDEATDAEEWKQAAHSLKGSARGIGAWQVATLAEAAEQLAISHTVPLSGARAAAIDDIRSIVALANVYIESLLAD